VSDHSKLKRNRPSGRGNLGFCPLRGVSAQRVCAPGETPRRLHLATACVACLPATHPNYTLLGLRVRFLMGVRLVSLPRLGRNAGIGYGTEVPNHFSGTLWFTFAHWHTYSYTPQQFTRFGCDFPHWLRDRCPATLAYIFVYTQQFNKFGRDFPHWLWDRCPATGL
jgi:hypothetical protein